MNHGFVHVTSSPRYPQSNGEAEWTVRTMKRLLKRDDDQHIALMVYRSTSLQLEWAISSRNTHGPTIAHSTTHPPNRSETERFPRRAPGKEGRSTSFRPAAKLQLTTQSTRLTKATTWRSSLDQRPKLWAAVFTFNPYLFISINELLISIIHLLISIIHLLISIIHLLISIIHLLISIIHLFISIIHLCISIKMAASAIFIDKNRGQAKTRTFTR